MNNDAEKYNPFKDNSLHAIVKEEHIIKDDREGFNDALNHYDIVNGFQSQKSITGLPKSLRNVIRIFICIGVLSFIILLVYSFINNLMDI